MFWQSWCRGRFSLVLLLLAIEGCGLEGLGTSPEIESRSDALVNDVDGDGITDAADNCPRTANTDQANSNGFGPGDACELSLVLSTGLLNQYVQYQSHRTLIANLGPLVFGLGPDLMRVSVPAPPFAYPNATLLSARMGVQSFGELLPGYTDTIGGNEVLRVDVGQDSVLGGAHALDVWLRFDGTGTASVTFFSGGTSLGTQTAANSGTQRTRFAAGGALFDRIEIRVTSGRLALKGAGEIITFTMGKAVVPCPLGYERVGAQCIDINECEGLNKLCHALTTCINTEGSYTCSPCPTGYTGTGATGCIDINECEVGMPCSPHVLCSNTEGSYQCGACPSGYRGDGHICTEIDECEESLDGCDPLVTCTNIPGSYICGDCPAGYTGGGQTGCIDINECVGPNHVCDSLVECTNTEGGFTCGPCPEGYRGTGATGCSDIDECAEGTATCSTLVACGNTAGSYQCGACPSGYTGDGHTCTDIDECELGTDSCSELVECQNTNGSYTCGACPNGYTGDGQTCDDIDECASHPCDPRVTCDNTVGGYLCGACPVGFSGDGYAGCVDIDECALDLDDCSPLVTCGNTLGGYICSPCPEGYEGDGRTCNDIDECATHAAFCSEVSSCTNTVGSYLCGPCPTGYTGNGVVCEDLDECLLQPCHALTTCTNIPGSYECGACPAGYAGDGYAGCVDIDECAVGNGGCPESEGCHNTIGSRTCVPCAAGSVGFATTCGIGACQREGSAVCVRGVVVDTCTEGFPAPFDAFCDGVDDDCDGAVDDDFVPLQINCGVGQCARFSFEQCVNGSIVDTCVPGEPAPLDDTCDLLDDDCDGWVDEDFPVVVTTCGQGACESQGVLSCFNGFIEDTCFPGFPFFGDYICDNIDEDCDGMVDEDYMPEFADCGLTMCVSGTVQCM